MKFIEKDTECPACKSSWIDQEIPLKDRKHFGGSQYYLRSIGIDGGYMGIYDGTVAIQCPDCKEYFPRAKAPWAVEMYNKFMDAMTKEIS
jgi:hypothetical protein